MAYLRVRNVAEVGWVNLPKVGIYEVQENVFSGSIRHRVYKDNNFFHDWFDGKAPFEPLKEVTREG